MESESTKSPEQIFAERATEAFETLCDKIDDIYRQANEQFKDARPREISDAPRKLLVEGGKVSFSYRDLYFEHEGSQSSYRINSKDTDPTVDPRVLEIVTNVLREQDVIGEYIKILYSLQVETNGEESNITKL